MPQTKRLRIDINGIVQGVGFRPTVYRYAKEKELSGWVSNTSSGVIIEVEGASSNIDDFLHSLKSSPPPQAQINDIKICSLTIQNENQFKILPSIISPNIKTQRSSTLVQRSSTLVQISPDIATCPECLRELFNPGDRRYLYPFLNCTHCGPRFTIVKSIPYDRNNTTMEKFTMCPLCRAEYDNPLDRRFHAQPNACPKCGPLLTLVSHHSSFVSRKGKDAIIDTIKLLSNGKIVAIKGLGGFHLACNALNEKAVKTLRTRKYREDKPFALMAKDVETIKKFSYVSDEEEKLLTSSKRPIVLLKKRTDCNISPSVAPNNKHLGFMLPYTPLHQLLFLPRDTRCEMRDAVLVMTSGNISDEPIAYHNEEAISRLSDIADYFLTHNRDIHIRCDDSVTRVFPNTQRELIIRRSRGYVPRPLTVPFTFKEEILACGAHLKNTFALAKENQIYLSHHIGDLENLETLNAFEKGIEHFKDIFKVKPKIIAHDLHPAYLSTKYAKNIHDTNNKIRLLGIQHHHAHIASCMADNGLKNHKVIGIAFDGTGYGDDGCLWGSEFMVADYKSYERKAYLKYIPLPGGSQAIKEPWRMAAAYLYKAYGRDIIHKFDRPFQKGQEKWNIIEKMIKHGINSPLTSSMGRLFDAVSSLIGLRDTINYEGQAAIELEQIAKPIDTTKIYNYRIKTENQLYIIDTIPIIKGIVKDLQRNIPASTISAKFHFTISEIILDTCKLISLETGLSFVALSGGVFQNMILLSKTYTRLKKAGFKVYIHNKVPANDGGISLGQTVIANSNLE